MKIAVRTAKSIATLTLSTIFATGMNPVLAKPAAENPAALADALHAAITAGDAQVLGEMLDSKVLIFESGGVESSLEEYASHHMHSDMEFMAGMSREVLDREVYETDTMAVVSTRSRLSGKFRDREIDLFNTETLLMMSTAEGWKIHHIHWSSAAAE